MTKALGLPNVNYNTKNKQNIMWALVCCSVNSEKYLIAKDLIIAI